MAMLQSDTIEERILYWLSLDLQVRALAERLLQRFAVTVGDLPASAAHHHAAPGGLYRHSLEVALRPTARRTRLVLAGPSSSCRFLRRRGLPRRTATVAPVLVSGGRPQQGNCKSAFADGQPRRPSQRRAGPACHRRPARQQGQPVVAGVP